MAVKQRAFSNASLFARLCRSGDELLTRSRQVEPSGFKGSEECEEEEEEAISMLWTRADAHEMKRRSPRGGSRRLSRNRIRFFSARQSLTNWSKCGFFFASPSGCESNDSGLVHPARSFPLSPVAVVIRRANHGDIARSSSSGVREDPGRQAGSILHLSRREAFMILTGFCHSKL